MPQLRTAPFIFTQIFFQLINIVPAARPGDSRNKLNVSQVSWSPPPSCPVSSANVSRSNLFTISCLSIQWVLRARSRPGQAHLARQKYHRWFADPEETSAPGPGVTNSGPHWDCPRHGKYYYRMETSYNCVNMYLEEINRWHVSSMNISLILVWMQASSCQ